MDSATDQKFVVHIKTGLTITDFLKFDAIKNEYTVNAIIWFAFFYPLETIQKFSFTKGEIVKKSEPIISKTSDNKTVVLYNLRVLHYDPQFIEDSRLIVITIFF